MKNNFCQIHVNIKNSRLPLVVRHVFEHLPDCIQNTVPVGQVVFFFDATDTLGEDPGQFLEHLPEAKQNVSPKSHLVLWFILSFCKKSVLKHPPFVHLPVYETNNKVEVIDNHSKLL